VRNEQCHRNEILAKVATDVVYRYQSQSRTASSRYLVIEYQAIGMLHCGDGTVVSTGQGCHCCIARQRKGVNSPVTTFQVY